MTTRTRSTKVVIPPEEEPNPVNVSDMSKINYGYVYNSVIEMIKMRHDKINVFDIKFMLSAAETKPTLDAVFIPSKHHVMFISFNDNGKKYVYYIVSNHNTKPFKDTKKLPVTIEPDHFVLITTHVLREKAVYSFANKLYDTLKGSPTVESISLSVPVLRIHKHISFPVASKVTNSDNITITGYMSIEDPICVYYNYQVADIIRLEHDEPLSTGKMIEYRKVVDVSLKGDSVKFVNRLLKSGPVIVDDITIDDDEDVIVDDVTIDDDDDIVDDDTEDLDSENEDLVDDELLDDDEPLEDLLDEDND